MNMRCIIPGVVGGLAAIAILIGAALNIVRHAEATAADHGPRIGMAGDDWESRV